MISGVPPKTRMPPPDEMSRPFRSTRAWPGQGDFGVFPKCQGAAQLAKPVVHTPILSAISVNKKIKAAPIRHFVGFVFGLCSARLDISEGNSEFRHVTVSVLTVCFDTVKDTVKVAGFQWTLKHILKRKTRDLTGSFAGLWTSLDVLLLVLGGERGIRTPDRL